MSWRRCLILAALALTAACQSSATIQSAPSSSAASELGLAIPRPQAPAEIRVSGTYKHPFIDLAFPTNAGPFKRSVIFQYDEDGMDVSASYLAKTTVGEIEASVHVYPVTAVSQETRYNDLRDQRLCRAMFGETLKEAQSLYLRPWLKETGEAAGYFRGYRGIFDAEARIASIAAREVSTPRDGPLSSEVYLNCAQIRTLPDGAMEIDPRWLVEYRITYPQELEARTLIDDWIAAVPIRQSPAN